MTPIDFVLTVLAMIIAGVVSTIIIGFLGFFTIKRMINKAMESEEIKEFKHAFEALKSEIESFKERVEKLFNADSEMIA